MKLLFKKYENFLKWSLGSFNVATFTLILFFKKDSSDDCCMIGALGSLFLPFVLAIGLFITFWFLIYKFVFKKGKKMVDEKIERDLTKEHLLRNIDDELKKKNEGIKNSNVTEEIENFFK